MQIFKFPQCLQGTALLRQPKFQTKWLQGATRMAVRTNFVTPGGGGSSFLFSSTTLMSRPHMATAWLDACARTVRRGRKRATRLSANLSALSTNLPSRASARRRALALPLPHHHRRRATPSPPLAAPASARGGEGEGEGEGRGRGRGRGRGQATGGSKRAT